MSLPILGPGVAPVGSSCELYSAAAENTSDTSGNSTVVCCKTNDLQSSTISQCSSLSDLDQSHSLEPFFLNRNPSPKGLANHIANLFEAGGVNHDFSPDEAQKFVSDMRAVQKPTGNKITRNIQEGTSQIEFRPKHGLLDIHGLGIFLQKKGGFAGCHACVEQKCTADVEKLSHSSINIRNYQDAVDQKYKQLWEDRGPENSEKYEVPESGYRASTTWPERKKTADQLERQLSYQKRLFQRALNIMNNKQRDSDKEIPFDPAFTRIFILTDKERRANKVGLFSMATEINVFFEYKTKVVPLEEEEACIAEVNNMPTRTIDQIRDTIEADLQAHPIAMVDLHKISHLLEKLGGFASSSALVEREYVIDGKECNCTAIVLRNYQDLVTEKYIQLWDKHNRQLKSLSHAPPKCDYSVPLLRRQRTSEEANDQLSYQKQLLKKAIEEMYVNEEPFDPLFDRIFIPTDQGRIDNGASISNIAQTDTILFVYAKPENENLPIREVDQICAAIETWVASSVEKVKEAPLSILGEVKKNMINFFPIAGKK